MRYESYPPIGTHTNRFIVHDYEELCIPKFDYRHESGRLNPVDGAIPEESFKAPKITLPHLTGVIFDACIDHDAHRVASSGTTRALAGRPNS